MSVNPLLLNDFQDKPHAEQESILQEIRLSIIGDEDEKLILLNSSSSTELFKLLDRYVVGDETNSQILEHLLIIISSLSYLPIALPKLINEYHVLSKLMVISNLFSDNHGILSIIFKLLSNILSLKHDLNLELNTSEGYSFKNLLFNKLESDATDNYKIVHDNSLLLNIFTLIPHLNPLELKNLINPSLRILEIVLNKPTNYLLSKYSNKRFYSGCFDSLIVPNSPPLFLFSNLTGPLLYSLSHLLYYDQESLMKTFTDSADHTNDIEELNKKNKIDKTFNKNLYFTISSLLKSSDFELKLSAISILINFSLNSTLTEGEKNKNVRKFLPYLIQLIDLDESNNLIVFKSELKLSRRFNPFYILSKLCLNFEFVNDYLLNCNIIKNFCEIITKFNNSDFDSLSLLKLDNLSDLFLILSSITSNSEPNRQLITKHDLAPAIHKILEFHYMNLVKYLKDEGDEITIDDSLENGASQNIEELVIASNHLTVSTCYLLRSLSRSVSILRTYLHESNIVENLLNILKVSEDSLLKLKNKNFVIIRAEILLKTVILSIISNLILDFSPLRNELLNKNLVDIVADLLLTTTHNSIRANCLWVFRHTIYNETVMNRDKTIERVGIDNLIQFCNDDDLMIQEQAFNVFRNLLCQSKIHVNKFLNHFLDENKAENYFFRFLYDKLSNISVKDSKNVGVLESMLFILVHIAASTEVKRELIAKHEFLLEKVKDVLTTTESDEVRLPCVWLAVNLTWIENIQDQEIYRGAADSFLPTGGPQSRSNNFFEDQDVMDEDDDEDEEEDEDDDEGFGETRRVLRSHVASGNTRGGSEFQNSNANYTDNVVKRANILNRLGYTEVLSGFSDSDNIDLRERAKTAVFNLNHLINR
ncbi:hypothetical protein WICANDRAFT_102727 [Wickerhamomyces anomalus NRRL Y-366-8]|uniref:Armadillo repeat-containing protein 8 n=1 Tax=Wickerhamomyces anomalus (strain ATCC 58044 / CBS 1984 / NCYC 433 / NRRL Y-366-8) TaxID=683960 RepID=A0A1E3P918_WICAA|nr:uncharacterized protein WICANDRAFT_102727 [Wickerhamomyces anomalus NRRL Y-366-8]ODQ61868.1 hypothetical protein WICANDRAFT_102727 [Wickerhamomyces anomalus NRRL Y-366-8]